MAQITNFLKKENLEDKVRLLLQVHDELVFEIDEKLVKEVAPMLQKIMEEAMPKDMSRGIVCRANAAYGPNWDDMEEINN